MRETVSRGLLALTLVLALALMGFVSVAPSFATDPSPESVVAVKTEILDDGASGYAAAHNSDYVVSRYYGVGDVFVSLDVTTTTRITPTLQHSPDGVLWYSGTAMTAITTDTAGYAMSRTALYGEYLRVSFAVSDTYRYTPTVKITLKNN